MAQYQNKHAKRFEDEVKKYFSVKLRQKKFKVDQVRPILMEAARKTALIHTNNDIEKSLAEIDQKFSEIHELYEQIHGKNLEAKRHQLEMVISELAAIFVQTDFMVADLFLQYCDDHTKVIDNFYIDYPDYKDKAIQILQNNNLL